MNLSQLPYIIAIAEEGNLSAASKVLGVSQPGLSKYLTKLEQEIGLPLFQVEKHQYRPTQAGYLYISTAKQILSIQQKTLSDIHAMSARTQEKLYVGVTPHQGAQTIAELFPLLRQQFPGIRIELYEGYTQALYAAVMEGTVSLAMTSVIETACNVGLVPMFEEEILLCVPSFYAQAHLSSSDAEQMGTIDLAEFADAPFVMMKENTSIGCETFRALREAGIKPSIVFSSENGYIVDQMIRSGSGIGFVPRHYAVLSDAVVYFHLKRPLYFTSCVIIPAGSKPTEAMRYLIYLLHQRNKNDKTITPCSGDVLQELCAVFDKSQSAMSFRGIL